MDIKAQVGQVLSDPINLPSAFLDYLLQYAALNPIPSGAVSAPIVNSTGLSGATKASRLVGSTTSGSPSQGTFQKGDLVIAQDGHVWVCTLAGSPGTWVDASVAPLQAASAVTFAGDVHLTTTGNTMEQASVLTLKSSVSDPTVKPGTSLSGVGSIFVTGVNHFLYVCYTWVDGGGHESAPSPVSDALNVPITASPSVSVAITVPALPTGITGFHIYALRKSNSTPPAAATLLRQAATTYISSETVSPTTWSSYNAAGANPPGASTFPAGTPALVKDTNGNTMLSGAGTVTGTTVTGTTAVTSLTVTATGPTQGIGYATGAGCTGTQATSKTTTVTLNADRVTGQVTMNNAALAAGATVSFSVTNTAVGANDVVVASIVGPAGTSGSYAMSEPHVANGGGGFRLFVTNTTAGPLSDALVISFAVIKVATS